MSDPNKKFLTQPDQYEINQSVLNKARSDKFLMILNLPEALRQLKSRERSNSKVDFDSLQFTIKGSPVPDIIIESVGLKYSGQELKISSHSRKPYDNIFVDFKVDNLFRNWWTIYSWLDLLNDEELSFYNRNDIAPHESWEAMKDYTATFTVFGLDEYNNRVIEFTYEGAFPVSVTSPKYDDTTEDEIKSKFEFSFTFFKAKLL